MQVKQYITDDDDAVSPVIGVILMVAITVILAAVIATFVLGLGDQVSDSSPQASFSFDYESGSPGTLTITHDGGAAIKDSNLHIRSESGIDQPWGSSGSKVKAGTSTSVSDSSLSTTTVRVVWESPDSDDSSTLGKWSGSDA